MGLSIGIACGVSATLDAVACRLGVSLLFESPAISCEVVVLHESFFPAADLNSDAEVLFVAVG